VVVSPYTLSGLAPCRDRRRGVVGLALLFEMSVLSVSVGWTGMPDPIAIGCIADLGAAGSIGAIKSNVFRMEEV
jgi:hypothetical protein